MPYFKRLPYAEMMAQKQAAAASPPTDAKSSAEPGILSLANDILAAETGNAAAAEPFRPQKPSAPGAFTDMVLTFENLAADMPARVSLTPGDLHGPDGAVIPARLVQATPSELTIPPGGASDVLVKIAVPADAKPGSYIGHVSTAGEEPLRCPVEVAVA